MSLTGKRTFVGFGFGAIQSGLFLYEAYQAGTFHRLVVAEVAQQMVSAIRCEGGVFKINIAHQDRIESVSIGPVEILDTAVEIDRQILLDAIVDAEEIATAIPNVANYVSEGPASIHRLLANGLCQKISQGGPRAIVYAAENHNHAAELLETAVLSFIPPAMHAAIHDRVRFLNTVIGKMSQVVTDPIEVRVRGLNPITPDYHRAFLVEAFNHILISRVEFPEVFQRGIQVFQERDDLLPFEEAKLFGHNATHALLGYLGALLGAQRVADLQKVPGLLPFARKAFIEESGVALIRKYTGLDPLFTPDGYQCFVDDLLNRMTNPFLVDMIERVTRDTRRKLGWNDRLIGTMRIALEQGIVPWRYALGSAAALVKLDPTILENRVSPRNVLESCWQEASPDLAQQDRLIALIESALVQLASWREEGFPNLEAHLQKG